MKFPSLRSGLRLPWFTANAARPNIFSTDDMNQIVALCNAVLNCPQFKISENNLLVNIAAASGSAVTIYKITTIPAGNKDYFMAKTWDGTTLGGSEIAIAKSFFDRPSVLNVTKLGDAITYVYSDDNHRTSSDGSNPTQSEELYDPFEVDVLTTSGWCVAAKVSNGTGVVDGSGNPVMWLDQTDRVWGKYA